MIPFMCRLCMYYLFWSQVETEFLCISRSTDFCILNSWFCNKYRKCIASTFATKNLLGLCVITGLYLFPSMREIKPALHCSVTRDTSLYMSSNGVSVELEHGSEPMVNCALYGWTVAWTPKFWTILCLCDCLVLATLLPLFTVTTVSCYWSLLLRSMNCSLLSAVGFSVNHFDCSLPLLFSAVVHLFCSLLLCTVFDIVVFNFLKRVILLPDPKTATAVVHFP